MLRSLKSRGVFFQGEGGRWSVRGPVAWNELPSRVGALVREQVETLDEPSRAVLETASVEGVEFCAETVAAALRQAVPRIVEILSGPLGRLRHLVAHSGARDFGRRRFSFYRFRHALVRSYVYGRLDEAERALRHDRAAAAMQTVFGETPPGAIDAEIRCEQ
jgi:predicted ATPase